MSGLSVLSVWSSQRLSGLTFSAGRPPSSSRAPSSRACCRGGSVYRVVHILIHCTILLIYYTFLWCKTRNANMVINSVDNYIYRRNSVDTHQTYMYHGLNLSTAKYNTQPCIDKNTVSWRSIFIVSEVLIIRDLLTRL